MNYWIIDRVNPDAGFDADEAARTVGLMGPRGCPSDPSPLTLPFRLVDDDGLVHAEGRMLPLDRHAGADTFAPLDNWGMPSLGCTSLEIPAEHLPGQPSTDGWVTV